MSLIRNISLRKSLHCSPWTLRFKDTGLKCSTVSQDLFLLSLSILPPTFLPQWFSWFSISNPHLACWIFIPAHSSFTVFSCALQRMWSRHVLKVTLLCAVNRFQRQTFLLFCRTPCVQVSCWSFHPSILSNSLSRAGPFRPSVKQHAGNVLYTSQPTPSVSKLGDGELC